MISIMTSITVTAIPAYFMIAGLFLITEDWRKLKDKRVVLSFVLWSLGGLALLYTGFFATAQGVMGISAAAEAILSVASVILLGKAYFIQDKEKSTSNNTISNA